MDFREDQRIIFWLTEYWDLIKIKLMKKYIFLILLSIGCQQKDPHYVNPLIWNLLEDKNSNNSQTTTPTDSEPSTEN